MLNLFFPIMPNAKQSFRFTNTGMKYQTKDVKEYSRNIKALLINQLPKGFKPLESAVKVEYEFRFPYTCSISKTKRKDTRTLYRSKNPDLDNLQKSINDAMNKAVFIDDSQIVEVYAKKVYSDSPGILVNISQIEHYS